MTSLFYPSSLTFVKKSAKQMQRVFPALQLSTAQEATACALGFSSWFDLSKRIETAPNTASLPDEAISPVERLRRRYQQIRALIDVANLPACEVEDFVRRWNLTAAAPATLLAEFYTDYALSDADLTALESGEVSEQELEEQYDWSWGGIPRRIADGIILGPCGPKYNYYQLSSARLHEMPLYLRGDASIFLDGENGGCVALAFPDLFSTEEKQAGLAFLAEREPWLHEWYTGSTPEDFDGTSLQQLSRLAANAPEDWFALSIRLRTDTFPEKMEYAAPALRGADFVRFIETKGHLRGLDVQWFAFKDSRSIMRFNNMCSGLGIEGTAPNRLEPQDIIPTEPLFGSPFKHGPMCFIEFSTMIEGGGMLLSEELEDDETDAS